MAGFLQNRFFMRENKKRRAKTSDYEIYFRFSIWDEITHLQKNMK